MEITRDGKAKKFNSYVVNIKVESQGDEDVLENLGKCNITLPDLLVRTRKVNKADAYSFCQKLNELYGNQ
jgi:hypothetical protein